MPLVEGDRRKPCCRPENGNLYRDEKEMAGRNDLVVMRCTVCDKRHFELTLDAGNLGMKGAPVG